MRGKRASKKPRRRRIRRSLVALSCLLVLLSVTVVWAHRTVLKTDAFVGTVAPVFKNPAVASPWRRAAPTSSVTELNLQAWLRAALPPKASFAAVPITYATKSFVAGELTKVLASPKSRAVWTGTTDRHASAGRWPRRAATTRRLFPPRAATSIPLSAQAGEGVGPGL